MSWTSGYGGAKSSNGPPPFTKTAPVLWPALCVSLLANPHFRYTSSTTAGFTHSQELGMAEPSSQRSLKRVWIWILILIVVVWIVYALTGGTKTPSTSTTGGAPASQQ